MRFFVFCFLAVFIVRTATAETFYPVELGVPSIISNSTGDDASLGDLWPVSNLLQGPGVGFEDAEPHSAFPHANGAPDLSWVTNANAGFPADYIEDVSIPAATLPRVVFDFGADAPIDEISVWAYSATNSNGVSEFFVRFASDAGGPEDFDNLDFPTFEFQPENAYICDGDPAWLPNAESDVLPDDNCGAARQSFEFGEVITARYVELTVTDNYFLPPGDGSGGAIDEFYPGYRELPGGDRVGLGEVAFRIPDDLPPASCDFDSSGVCDIVDLDELLYTGIGSGDSKYDLDGSGTVDLGDRDAFLAELGTVPGDFNFDGMVVAGDLNTLGGNWTQAVTSYADGDSNGDGQVTALDLNDLGQNWQFGAPAAAAVPEPTGSVAWLALVASLLMIRRKAK